MDGEKFPVQPRKDSQANSNIWSFDQLLGNGSSTLCIYFQTHVAIKTTLMLPTKLSSDNDSGVRHDL